MPYAKSCAYVLFTFVLAGIWSTLTLRTLAQSTPQNPPAPTSLRSRATPSPPHDADQVTGRLHTLERLNRQLADQLESANRQNDEEIRRLTAQIDALSSNRSNEPEGGAPEGRRDGAARPLSDLTLSAEAEYPGTPVIDYTEGHFAPFIPAPGYSILDPSSSDELSLQPAFSPGFQFQSADERLRLQIHYESQVEARIWEEEDQTPVNSGFFLPRQRVFFNGNVSKSIEYELAINRGLNNINLLNAYLNFHIDDRLEVRIGRFFTPFPFDQYATSNYWLLTPERSLFTTNLALNRQIGSMVWGYLCDKQIDYAAGIFNGSRNSFESVNNGVDVVAYLNTRPFQQSETLSFARFLNVGTSVAFGHQDQSPVPTTFRVGAGSPDANIPGVATVPFLILNPNVIERGDRLLGSVHGAYFYKGLSVIGEWQYGYGGYASSAQSSSARVPFSGYYVSGGYFLTGEHIERRTRVKPLYPLIPVSSNDERGLGAWELAGRVSRLSLGAEVFDGGFADPNLWSNSAVTSELGVNWYWNEYTKLYMFWLHAEFGSPVQYRPGERQKNADLFWVRCQLYF